MQVAGSPNAHLPSCCPPSAQVAVCDKREDFSASANRGSFNVVLNDRGRRALAGAGVELPEGGTVPLLGNARHIKGETRVGNMFFGNIAVNRGRLAEELFKAARAVPAIRHRFGSAGEITGLDLQDKKARRCRCRSLHADTCLHAIELA